MTPEDSDVQPHHRGCEYGLHRDQECPRPRPRSRKSDVMKPHNSACTHEGKSDNQRELAAVTAQLADEHSRSLTLETSWRDAEDRAAQNQFELERVKMELENAKMQLLEKRR